MAFAFSPKIVTNGLVLALDSANTKSYVSGSTVWRDLTSNLTTGSLINSPTFNSANGGSILFDGVDDYVDLVKDSLFNFGSSNFTISGWINFSSVAGEKGFYSYFQADGPNQNNGLVIRLSTGNSPSGLRIVASITGTDVVMQSAWSPSINTWYQILVVRNSTTISAYINAVFLNSTTINISIGTPSINKPVLAQTQTVLNSYLNGKLSLVQIYNRALSPTEVLQNYNATKSRFNIT